MIPYVIHKDDIAIKTQNNISNGQVMNVININIVIFSVVTRTHTFSFSKESSPNFASNN